MKILLLGGSGQLGWELQRSCAILGILRVCPRSEVDLTNKALLAKIIREYRPTHIINSSAYTAVDKAETDAALAFEVNAQAVGLIAEEAKKINSFFLHYSTDYVFDGTKKGPYVESDRPFPLNVYGRSKLEGERLIEQVGGHYIILRVSWVYGNHGQNFYRSMLHLGETRETLKIVSDQVGAPTWSRHIAEASTHMLSDKELFDKNGIYHLSPQGQTSWHEFAHQIFELTAKLQPGKKLKIQTVLPILTSEYAVGISSSAPRPLNSLLLSQKIFENFGINLPPWRQSLEMVINDCEF